MEKISVIIPIYNQEKYLEKCLKSIAIQTYANLEILMIDDGSTDTTSGICKKFQRNDPRFRYIRQKNAGVAAARNKGLDSQTGDLIGFVDPDDWIEPNFYEKLISLYHQYDVDIVSCGRKEVFDETSKSGVNKVYEVLQCNTDKALALLAENRRVKSHLWNRIYRVELFENLRFEEGRVYEDIWILHQIFARAKSFIFTDEPLYYYRQHQSSIVRAVTISKQLDHCYAHQSRFQFLIVNHPELQKQLVRNYSYEIIGLIDAAVSSNWKEIRLKKQQIMDAVKIYCQLSGAELYDKKIVWVHKNFWLTIIYYKIRKIIKQ